MGRKKLKYSCGFTLIELLVVLTIIAILATVATLYYTGLNARARDSVRRTTLYEVGNTLEINKAQDTYLPLDASQFNSFPTIDPGGNVYCIAPDSTIADPAFSVPWEGTCPAGFE